MDPSLEHLGQRLGRAEPYADTLRLEDARLGLLVEHAEQALKVFLVDSFAVIRDLGQQVAQLGHVLLIIQF